MSEKLEYFAVNHAFDPLVDEIIFTGQSQTDPLHAMGPLIHPHYIVHHIISGKGTVTMNGTTYELSSGDSFFIFPDEFVRYEADQAEPWKYCWIGFKGHRYKHLLKSIQITPDQPIIHNILDNELLHHYSKVYELLTEGSLSSGLNAVGYFQLIIARYSKERELHQLIRSNKTAAQLAIDDVVAYINFNYPQQLTIVELADRIGYHRSHLSKLFKQIHGISPLSYLINVRLEQAKLLLAQGISVHQTAVAVGFQDPLYFSKLFKRHIGMNPSQYQAAHNDH